MTLSRALWVMEAEVTQAQYEAVMGYNPSFFPDVPANPVDFVSWDDAVIFAARVSEDAGLTACGGVASDTCDGWRLPTEAEWEYFARAGEESMFAGSDVVGDVAWTSDAGATAPTLGCSLGRNAWGLCDLSGNLYEWTLDRYGAYEAGAVTDPGGPGEGADRVVRGGTWSTSAVAARVASRQHGAPDLRIGTVGFRLVRVAGEEVRAR